MVETPMAMPLEFFKINFKIKDFNFRRAIYR